MSKNSIDILSLIPEFNKLYIEDLNLKSHHSVFIEEDAYQILIIRGLDFSNEGLEFNSSGIVFHNDIPYSYDKTSGGLKKVDNGLNQLFNFLKPIYALNKKIIDSYILQIDPLEDGIFERKTPKFFIDSWFELKMQLSKIERHLLRNYQVLKDFIQSKSKKKGFQHLEFKDLLRTLYQSHSNVNTQISRLDSCIYSA